MSANEETQTKRPNYFLWTAPLVSALATIAVVKPTLFTNTITDVSKFFYMKFDWLIMWLPLLAFTVCMTVALSPASAISGWAERMPSRNIHSFLG